MVIKRSRFSSIMSPACDEQCSTERIFRRSSNSWSLRLVTRDRFELMIDFHAAGSRTAAIGKYWHCKMLTLLSSVRDVGQHDMQHSNFQCHEVGRIKSHIDSFVTPREATAGFCCLRNLSYFCNFSSE